MTPQFALKEFGHRLSLYEQKEIMEYPEVWFLGMDSKKVEGVMGAAQNSGTNAPLIQNSYGSNAKFRHQYPQLQSLL